MTEFTPMSAIAGGLLLGLSTVLLLWFNGRIAGISGIFYGAMRGTDKSWRWWFLAGLLVGCGLWVGITRPEIDLRSDDFAWWMVAIAGFVVGFGTRLGSGCTSGHGICGIGRLSTRSMIATVTFFAAGMVSVYVVRHVLGVAS